jgi:hypothetical protein
MKVNLLKLLSRSTLRFQLVNEIIGFYCVVGVHLHDILPGLLHLKKQAFHYEHFSCATYGSKV